MALMEGDEQEFCFLIIDIVDHSKIFESNPSDAVEKTLDEFEKYVEEKVTKNHGEIWSWQGDGGTCVFSEGKKAINAINCALDILTNIDLYNINIERKPIKEKIMVRIGCHQGKAKYRQQTGRIHSTAINLAAHLQKKVSKPNNLAITGDVYKELWDPLKTKFHKDRSISFQGKEIFVLGDSLSTRPEPLPNPFWDKIWTKQEEIAAIEDIANSIINSKWNVEYIISVLDPEAPGGVEVGARLISLLTNNISPDPHLVTIVIKGRDPLKDRVVTSIPLIEKHKIKILIVDDATFTGRTLETTYYAILKICPNAEIKFATLAVGKELEQKMKEGKTPIFMEFPYKIVSSGRVTFSWGRVGPTGTPIDIHNIQYPDFDYLIRPWGFMEIFAKSNKAFVRILTLMPNTKLSYHKHKMRDEYFIPLDDGLMIEIAGEPKEPANKGMYIPIPRGIYHRISNSGNSPARSLEVAYGNMYDQNDIERCDDDYGRPNIGDGSL